MILGKYCLLLLLWIPSSASADDFGNLFPKKVTPAQQDRSQRAGGARVTQFKGGLLEKSKHYEARIEFDGRNWGFLERLASPENAAHVSVIWSNIQRFSRMRNMPKGGQLTCVFTVLDVQTQCLLPPCENGPSDASYVLEIHSIR